MNVSKVKNDVYYVFNSKLARILLKKNYKIVDVRQNESHQNKIVFYFKIEDGLIEEVECFQTFSKV